MSFEVEVDEDSRVASLAIGPFHANVDLDQFSTPLDDAAKRRLFKRSVNRVAVEIFSYCNRRCGFCPNRDGHRMISRDVLPSETFERIVNDLKAIGFDKPFYFHLYNEPLADLPVLLARMEYARPRLPGSPFQITSNGDYLTLDVFQKLRDAGCNRIFVSTYGPNHGRWDEPYIVRRIGEIASALGLDAAMLAHPGKSYWMMGAVDGVEMTIAGQNLWRSGYDRGGLVPELAAQRSSPCLSPISDVSIDFRGYMLPCCNVYTDTPEHRDYTYGNVNDADIFTVYASAAAQRWKQSLLTFKPGGSLCGECSRGNYPEYDTEENRAALARLRGALTGRPATKGAD